MLNKIKTDERSTSNIQRPTSNTDKLIFRFQVGLVFGLDGLHHFQQFAFLDDAFLEQQTGNGFKLDGVRYQQFFQADKFLDCLMFRYREMAIQSRRLDFRASVFTAAPVIARVLRLNPPAVKARPPVAPGSMPD